jgi:hypothetical protein
LRASTTETRKKVRDEFYEKRLELAEKHVGLVVRRMEAAIARVEKLANRVAVALDKFGTQGTNVALARTHLEDAKIKIVDARAKVIVLKASAVTVLESENPGEGMKQIMKLAKAVVDTVQSAHRSVAQAIVAIKPGLNKPHATTTQGRGVTSTSTSNQ